MTPLKLTITGSIGVKAGLGRDELDLDLEKIIPDEALTVALRGDNGSGKSTLLNLAMTPWLTPPMLDGNAYEHFGAEGERILEWEHGQTRYRSKIQYKQTPKTRSTSAALHVQKDGKWVPMTLPDHTTSDGKTSTYNACLEYLLGPQQIYYLSAFRAQGAPRLADYDDPKALMRDLLQLDKIKNLADRASGIRSELNRTYLGIRDQADALAEKALAVDALNADIKKLDAEIPEQKDALRDLDAYMEVAKAEYSAAVKESRDHKKLRAEREKVEARIAEINAELGQVNNEAHQDVADLDAALDVRLKEHADTHHHMHADIQSIRTRIFRNQELLDQAEEIESAVEALDELRNELVALKQEELGLRSKDEEKKKLALEMTGIGSTVNVVRREGVALKAQADDLERRAALTDKALFGEKCFPCPLLTDAVDAHKGIDAVTADLSDARAEYSRLIAAAAGKRDLFEDLGDTQAALSSKLAEVQDKRVSIDATQSTAARMPALRIATEDIKQAEDQLKTQAEMVAHLEQTKNSAVTTHYQATKRIETRAAEKRESIGSSLAEKHAELDRMPAPGDDSALAAARIALEDATDAAHQGRLNLEGVIASLSKWKADKDSLAREIEAGAKIAAQAKHLSAEIAKWRLLTDGLKGVIDLSIEDAGPSIAEKANHLLRQAYGPRFTVSIVTQRKNKTNETIKEVFDISVIDAETGLESSITKKSGGESVWLDKALTDAVGLYHQEVAGMQFETLFSDEAEDGLTAERKQAYYRMDRHALDIGGYRRKYFVSHNPDAWAMADAVIDMATLATR